MSLNGLDRWAEPRKLMLPSSASPNPAYCLFQERSGSQIRHRALEAIALEADDATFGMQGPDVAPGRSDYR